MRLAILVVYMFGPETRELFLLHLRKIRENTAVPYRIFASIGHLSAELRAEVAAQPDIEAVELPVGVLEIWRNEHADLLWRLFQQALGSTEGGGYTHFVTLHLDSFPLKKDWTAPILHRLEAGDQFATIAPHGYSACLFWPRRFHDAHGFALVVPETVRQSEPFRRFQAEFPDHDNYETGLGFLYGCWLAGLPWYAIRPTATHVYGDLIFHLVGGTRFVRDEYTPIRFQRVFDRMKPLTRIAKVFVPKPLLRSVRKRLADPHYVSRDGTHFDKRRELKLLLADPEAFIGLDSG